MLWFKRKIQAQKVEEMILYWHKNENNNNNIKCKDFYFNSFESMENDENLMFKMIMKSNKNQNQIWLLNDKTVNILQHKKVV